MSFANRVRETLVDLAAYAINDRHIYPTLSYRWLNQTAWQIVRRDRIAARRPQYVWGVLHAAALAKTLGHTSVAALELGVAGGRGLVALEAGAVAVEQMLGIRVNVFGLDTGYGLPKSEDPRDLPNLYAAGEYKMDVPTLKAMLTRAQLVLGKIGDTVGDFLASLESPIGFISLDVDLYSSTVEAFPIFDAPNDRILPRVHMYLDDCVGMTFSEFNGERLALREFNDARTASKIDAIPRLCHDLPWPFSSAKWPDMMFMLHRFDHPHYARKDHLIPVGAAPL